MDDLLVAFRAGLSERAQLAFGPETEAATVEALRRHAAAARAAWSEITVTESELARELGRRLGDHATVEALTTCRGSDVFLTIAGTAGEPAAARAIMARLSISRSNSVGTSLAAPKGFTPWAMTGLCS